MRTALAGFIVAFAAMAAPLAAQDRVTLGYGRLFTNDYLGDNHDRWRSGSYVVSRVRGYEWTGRRPVSFGELRELRLRAEIIAPSSLTSPEAPPAGRRYVGALSLGMHTHWSKKQTEFSAGIDLVATGPQTGVGAFQREAHSLLGATPPEVLGNQIGNGVHPTASVEAGQPFRFSDSLMVRPFAEARVGAETLVRVGADVVIGTVGQQDLLLRDVTTGQLYRSVQEITQGISVVLGGDIAVVNSSVYLPSSNGFELTNTRQRARAGVHWQGEKAGIFYGVTWLGKEFSGQSEPQTVGSVRLSYDF